MQANLATRLLRCALLLLALAGVAVSIVPSIDTDTWWIRYLDFARLEFLIAMLVVAALLLIVGRTRLGYLALFGLAACAAYDAFVLFPFSGIAGVQERSATSCPNGAPLRLLEVNVQMTNRHDHTLLDMVKALKPDVAWFQETNDWWSKELSGLADTMPHHVSKIKPNYFGVDLYSRLPLVDPQIKDLTGSNNPSVFTGVTLPDGQTIRLYAIHPRPPQVGQSTAERAGQLMATALAAHDDKEPHILAGDLNSTPWEDVIRRTQRVGGLLDPRVGRGLYITWNANSFYLKWPLDQILVSPQFTLISLRVLKAFGSDHHPYFAELCLNPSAAAQQPAPAMDPNDLDVAHQAVERGQGKANSEGYKGRYEPDGSKTQ